MPTSSYGWISLFAWLRVLCASNTAAVIATQQLCQRTLRYAQRTFVHISVTLPAVIEQPYLILLMANENKLALKYLEKALKANSWLYRL